MGFFWFDFFFVCCFFTLFWGFLKDGVQREGETALGLAAFSCCNEILSLHECHFIFCCNIFFISQSGPGLVDLEVGLVTQRAFVFFLPPRVTTTPAEPKLSISAWTPWVWPSSSARRSSSSCRRSVRGSGSSSGCSKEAVLSLAIWKELGVFSPHKKLQVGCWLLVLGMHLFIRVARGTECRSRWRHCRQCAWWSGYMENEKSWLDAGESECVVAILWQCGRRWVVRLNNNNSYHLLMINEIPIQQPS